MRRSFDPSAASKPSLTGSESAPLATPSIAPPANTPPANNPPANNPPANDPPANDPLNSVLPSDTAPGTGARVGTVSRDRLVGDGWQPSTAAVRLLLAP